MVAKLDKLPWFLVIFNYCLMNSLDIFPSVDEKQLSNVWFLLFTIIIFLFAALSVIKNKDWFSRSILLFAGYYIFDELTGRSCIYNWWEIPLILSFFLINYLTRKNKIWNSFS